MLKALKIGFLFCFLSILTIEGGSFFKTFSYACGQAYNFIKPGNYKEFSQAPVTKTIEVIDADVLDDNDNSNSSVREIAFISTLFILCWLFNNAINQLVLFYRRSVSFIPLRTSPSFLQNFRI